MLSFLPLSVLHWYLPLTLQRAGNFAHCNLSVGEHEYLFIVCICPLCLLPLSPSVCQTSHFPSFLFHLPLHCYLAFSFVRVYICTYQCILYRTGRYVIRPSVNMEILSSFVSGWERLMNVCGQSLGLFVNIHRQVLKSMLSWTLLGTGTVFSLKGAFSQF